MFGQLIITLDFSIPYPTLKVNMIGAGRKNVKAGSRKTGIRPPLSCQRVASRNRKVTTCARVHVAFGLK